MNIDKTQPNNIFKSFSEIDTLQQSGQTYSSVQNPQPDSVNITTEKPNSDLLGAVKVSDTKKNKSNVLAYTVTTSILAAAVITLILTKGFSSDTYKKINQLIETLNDKIYESSISKKSKNIIEKISLAATKGVKKALTILKASSNFNAVKDSFCDKALRTNKVTATFADKVTALFKKFSYDSIIDGYNKVHIDTDNFHASIKGVIKKIKANKNIDLTQPVTIKDITKSLDEWLTELSEKGDELRTTFEKGFGKEAIDARAEFREEFLSGRINEKLEQLADQKGLNEKVWDTLYKDNAGLFNLKENAGTFKTYITEDLSMAGKDKSRNEILEARRLITNNVRHNYSLIKSSLQDMSTKINIDDVESRNMLSDISKKMNEYLAYTGPEEATNRAVKAEEIITYLHNLNKKIKGSDKYDEASAKFIDSQIDFIENGVLKHDKKGYMQEIMTIINGLKKQKLLEEKVAQDIDKASHSITNNLNKTTTSESTDLFDKLAELKVGSAPNDVLSLIFPAGVGVYAISKAKDKKERTSTTLTTGIPIIGSIGTMLVGAKKKMAGPKNLALALGVGVLLNFAGKLIDKLYLDYQEKQSFTQMAIDAYKNSIAYTTLNKK